MYMQWQGSSLPWFSHLQMQNLKICTCLTLNSYDYKSFPAGMKKKKRLKENLCVATLQWASSLKIEINLPSLISISCVWT